MGLGMFNKVVDEILDPLRLEESSNNSKLWRGIERIGHLMRERPSESSRVRCHLNSWSKKFNEAQSILQQPMRERRGGNFFKI